MAKTYSWGVISTAHIGVNKVIPAMQKSGTVSVDAIASRSLDSAKATAGKLGIGKAYGSYEELLADPEIQFIYNPLPNHLHVPWTIKAMEAGKHVLCEKPIALTVDEAKQLVEARERTGKQVVEAFMVRHHPQWQRARELVRTGALGEVRAISTVFSYFLTDPTNVRNMADIGGGGLYDIGCYAITTARYLFGSDPLRISALIDRDPEMKTDRLTSAIGDFGNGRHLVFSCSTQLVPYQRVQVLGTKGRLEVELPFNADPNRPMRLLLDDGSSLDGSSIRVEEIPVVDQYQLQAEDFSRAVTVGEPLEFPIEDAVVNMRVIEAAFRSGASGQWETV